MQNHKSQACRWKDEIRKRPSMYVGDLRLKGFKQMLKYLFEEILEDCFENPIFELIFFRKNRIVIKIGNANAQKIISRLNNLQEIGDRIFSLGLEVFIALSSEISIVISSLPTSLVLYGQRGDFEVFTAPSQKEESNVIIDCTVDGEIFKNYELVYEQINDFLRQFSFLNPNLKIISVDKTTDELQRNIFFYPAGIFEYLDYFISQQLYQIPAMRIDIEAHIEKYSYKIGIAYSSIFPAKSFIKTYAGNTETYLGGSFNDGILEGIILSIKEIAQKEKVDIIINRRLVKEHLIIIAAVRGENFNFEGSIREKLGMPKLKKDVRKLVFENMINYFYLNIQAKKDILNKFSKWK